MPDLTTYEPTVTPYTFPLRLWSLMQNVPYFRDVVAKYQDAFTEEYPKTPVVGPVVSWSIHRRWPGKESRERYTSRFRGRYQDAEGDLWDLQGQWWSVLYEFRCHHATNAEASALAWAFEEAVRDLTPALKEDPRVERVLFDEQIDDRILHTDDLPNVRTLRYLVVLDMTHSTPVQTIDTLEIVHRFDSETIRFPMSRGSGTPLDSLPTVQANGAPMGRLRIQTVWQTLPDGTIRTYARGSDYCVVELDEQATANACAFALEWLAKGAHPSVGDPYWVEGLHHAGTETRIVG